jgi:hypothetical protein
MKPRLACLLALTIAAPALLPTAADAKPKAKASGPVLKIASMAINEQSFAPGTKITEKSPINACYYIFGEAGTPPSLLFVANIHAKHIPPSAPTTLTLTPAWTSSGLGAPVTVTGQPFSKAVFDNPGHGIGALNGGVKGDWFRWDELQGGSTRSGDGTYTIAISVQVGGQTLTAHGSLTVAC